MEIALCLVIVIIAGFIIVEILDELDNGKKYW